MGLQICRSLSFLCIYTLYTLSNPERQTCIKPKPIFVFPKVIIIKNHLFEPSSYGCRTYDILSYLQRLSTSEVSMTQFITCSCLMCIEWVSSRPSIRLQHWSGKHWTNKRWQGGQYFLRGVKLRQKISWNVHLAQVCLNTTFNCKDVTRLCPQVFAGMQAQVHPHGPPSKVSCGYKVCVPINSNLQGRDLKNSSFASCWVIDTISQ